MSESTADDLERLFYVALRVGDTEGVDAALRVLCTVDPRRAGHIHEALRLAVDLVDIVESTLSPASERPMGES